MKNKNFRKLNIVLLASLTLGCFSSCANNTLVEDDPIIAVDRKIDEINYNLDNVSRGEVIKTKNINCEYVQTKEQEVSFPFGGKIVDKVYVRQGDKVSKGDILVELKTDNLEVQILDLEYEIKKLNMELGYLDIQEEFDKRSAHDSYIHSKLDGQADCDYLENLASIERDYTYRREDYADSINYNTKKLEKLNEELSSKRLYADMDGTIISLKPNLEGSTAKRDAVIMTVVDNSNGLFECKDSSIKEFIKENDVLTMSIVYGSAKGDYEIVPYEYESWGEKQLFKVSDTSEITGLEVGTSGTIKAILEKKENVLRIPYSALYEADDRYYTYILDEDNLRKVQFIEVGLIGDSYVEVLSGLSENEKVIKK